MALPLIQSSASTNVIAGTMRMTRDLPLPWDKLEGDVIAWADTALRQAEEEASTSLSSKLIPRIIQYLAGNQWPSRPTAYGNSRPVTNRMFRQYWELVSLLTDGKPEPQIKVYDTQDGYSEIQKMLNAGLELWASSPQYQDALQNIIGFGLLAYGVGKVQWNPRLKGGMGDVELKDINPLNFFKLGGDGTVEGSECVIETELVSMAALKRRYGSIVDGIEPEPMGNPVSSQVMRPRQMSSAEWSKFSPQMQRLLGVKGNMGMSDALYPMIRRRLYWFRDSSKNETSRTIRVGPEHANWSYLVEPGMPLFPRGRVLTVAGKRVLNDTCNCYFHDCGPGPYVEFTPLRAPWTAEGMSLTGNLIGPQDILNRVMAGMLETIKAGLIPTIITPRNSISRSDLDNISTTISGGKLEYNPLAAQPPKFREQPQVPTLAQWFAQVTMREMDQTTGSAAIDAAAQKEQIPSHDTMELIQNSRSGMVRLMGRRLEAFLNRGGQMVISNMLQFYSVGHRVAILGEKGLTDMDFAPAYGSMMHGGMAPESFVRKFQFSIRPGSALSFDRETRAQMATILCERGLLSRKNMFRALNAAGANIDIAQNEAELAQEALQKLALAALGSQAAGKGKH